MGLTEFLKSKLQGEPLSEEEIAQKEEERKQRKRERAEERKHEAELKRELRKIEFEAYIKARKELALETGRAKAAKKGGSGFGGFFNTLADMGEKFSAASKGITSGIEINPNGAQSDLDVNPNGSQMESFGVVEKRSKHKKKRREVLDPFEI